MLIWISLFLLLILIEAFIGDFTALAISLGAIGAIIGAYFNLTFDIQLYILGITSLASVFFLKPYFKKNLTPTEKSFTAESFVGEYGSVIEKISPDNKGRIKVGGEIWFAESTFHIPEGEKVIIIEIDSAIMKVIPKDEVHKLKNDLPQNNLNKKYMPDQEVT